MRDVSWGNDGWRCQNSVNATVGAILLFVVFFQRVKNTRTRLRCKSIQRGTIFQHRTFDLFFWQRSFHSHTRRLLGFFDTVVKLWAKLLSQCEQQQQIYSVLSDRVVLKLCFLPIWYQYIGFRYQLVSTSIRYHPTTNDAYFHLLFWSVKKSCIRWYYSATEVQDL